MKSLISYAKGLTALSAKHGASHAISHVRRGGFATLTVGSLGIVYGDIGTSPLYAMDQLFFGVASRIVSERLVGTSATRVRGTQEAIRMESWEQSE